VLVILAILTAIAIPALTGYIDKANQRAVISEARTVQIGLQAIESDAYGQNGGLPATDVSNATLLPDGYSSIDNNTTVGLEVASLAGQTTIGAIEEGTFDGSKLTGFEYTPVDGDYTATYDGTSYTVEKN
jgi:type II secretory pathway pseudopilin PulG